MTVHNCADALAVVVKSAVVKSVLVKAVVVRSVLVKAVMVVQPWSSCCSLAPLLQSLNYINLNYYHGRCSPAVGLFLNQ